MREGHLEQDEHGRVVGGAVVGVEAPAGRSQQLGPVDVALPGCRPHRHHGVQRRAGGAHLPQLLHGAVVGHGQHGTAVLQPVLQRLGQVGHADGIGASQVGHGAGHLQRTVQAAPAPAQPRSGLLQEAAGGIVQCGVGVQRRTFQQRVRHALALQLARPGRRHAGRIFNNQVQLSGSIPQVCLLFGPSAAGGAYIPALCDEVVIIRNQGAMFLGSPQLVFAATGEVVDSEALGGALMH